jgi:hypothetical protein
VTDREYLRRHELVRKVRGKASEHKCIDCGEPAREWSQRHDTEGIDPSDYDPRCCSCHQKYDDHWDAETRAKVSESVKKTWASNPGRRQFSNSHRQAMREAWVRRKAREGR